MNLLLIKERELVGTGKAEISGARAKYIYEFHDLKAGLTVRAGILNGALGQAEINFVSASRIELTFTPQQPALNPIPIYALVATPRPQAVKKILQLSAMMGFSGVCFFRSERVVGSYLSSKSLTPQAIEEQLILGLEQAGNTALPPISKCDSFHELINAFIPELISTRGSNSIKLLADTKSTAQKWNSPPLFRPSQLALLAIGPEAGFSQVEQEQFKAFGFMGLSLGPRILRVEVALAVFAAKVELLREIKTEAVL